MLLRRCRYRNRSRGATPTPRLTTTAVVVVEPDVLLLLADVLSRRGVTSW